MTALCLLTCALTVGQAPERADGRLAPQLSPGLELLYSGTFTEEALIPGVQFQRTYRLESAVFVLEGHADHWDVAFLTALSLQQARRTGAEPAKAAAEPASVRLELAQVDKRGRLKGAKGVSLALPLAGPPTLETGAILEFPPTALLRDRSWFVTDPGRPSQTWQFLGSESCNGTMCHKLAGQQQSEDWDRPRSDHAAWRRRDTVWVGPQLGVAYRVERVIERREPARREPTSRLRVRYDLDSRFRYPGNFFDYRALEIVKTLKFHEDAALLWKQPAQYQPQIDALLRKIALHVQNRPEPTPYRKALLNVQTRLEKARRGEVLAETTPDDPVEPIPTARVGQRAPDFVTTDLLGKKSVRLNQFLGQPALIVYFNPATSTGKQVLEHCQGLSDRHRGKLNILAMAVNDDAAVVARVHTELKLSFPILDGRGMHSTFGVEATPRIILLDGNGVVRGAYTGWGFQVPREIEADLQPWLER